MSDHTEDHTEGDASKLRLDEAGVILGGPGSARRSPCAVQDGHVARASIAYRFMVIAIGTSLIGAFSDAVRALSKLVGGTHA